MAEPEADSYECVIRSMYFIFWDPYFPIMKLILRAETYEDDKEGSWMSEEDKSRNWAKFLPKIYEKSIGVPQLLQLHEILVFKPNLSL